MENIYVFDDGVIRGFIEMNGTQLSKIYVDSFFQSQGVGDALIRYATVRIWCRQFMGIGKE